METNHKKSTAQLIGNADGLLAIIEEEIRISGTKEQSQTIIPLIGRLKEINNSILSNI